MTNKLVSGVAAAGLVLLSQQALAQPFNTFDPVSMAMGGVGVALPNPTTANLYNPSQISSFSAARDEDFAVGFSFGVRAYDQDEVLDVIGDAMDDFDELEELVERFNEAIANPGSVDDLERYSGQLADAARRLDANLMQASGKHAQVELGTALLTNLPMNGWGVGLSVSAQATIGARVHYADEDSGLLQAVANAAEEKTGFVNYDADDLQSEGELLGAAIAEVGITFAKRVSLLGPGVSIGITPKYVQVESIYYKARIDQTDSDDIDADDYRESYGDFNLDIGLTKDFGNGLYVGAVVKNLISRDYKTVTIDNENHTISLKPLARVGVGYDGGWFRVGADLDLTKNKPLAFEEGSQYFAVGAELSAFGWAQLRAGYRHDMVNSDRSVISAGIGLSPFKVLHLDLGLAANADEVGGALQMALTF